MMSPLQSLKQINTLTLMVQTVCNMHNRSHRKRRHQSFDDDDGDDGRLEEGLERGVRHEHFSESVLKDTEAKFMQVRIELKTVLMARIKIASLDFDIFSPAIIWKKKVKR